jgi:hypothetical protein
MDQMKELVWKCLTKKDKINVKRVAIVWFFFVLKYNFYFEIDSEVRVMLKQKPEHNHNVTEENCNFKCNSTWQFHDRNLVCDPFTFHCLTGRLFNDAFSTQKAI